MAVRTVSAFAAGVVVGWVGRSLAGSTRELIVQAIAEGHRAREAVRRTVAEQVEHVEDMLAEGRARYEAQEQTRHGDGEAAPHVKHSLVDKVIAFGKKKRGQAA